MDTEGRGRGDLLGALAASWIGGLGGLLVGGVLGQGATLISVGFTYYGGPTGYYASGTVYGFVGGACIGALAGLAAGAALAGRFGNRRAALLGGILGLVGAAAYGAIAYPLAVYLEGAYLQNAAVAGLLGAVAFAAVGGALATAIRSGAAQTGRRAALRDLIAGGILGLLMGMLGGGFTELATSAWAEPPVVSAFGMNVGVLFGLYLGAGVGAAVAVVAGVLVRRLRATRPLRGGPSDSPLQEVQGRVMRVRAARK